MRMRKGRGGEERTRERTQQRGSQRSKFSYEAGRGGARGCGHFRQVILARLPGHEGPRGSHSGAKVYAVGDLEQESNVRTVGGSSARSAVRDSQPHSRSPSDTWGPPITGPP